MHFALCKDLDLPQTPGSGALNLYLDFLPHPASSSGEVKLLWAESAVEALLACVCVPNPGARCCHLTLLLDVGFGTRLPMKKTRHCKVYYSILAICYLEVRTGCACRMHQSARSQRAEQPAPQVLFWTTCLLTSCATSAARPEDANYIARETVSAQRPWEAQRQTAHVASAFSAGGLIRSLTYPIHALRLHQADPGWAGRQTCCSLA